MRIKNSAFPAVCALFLATAGVFAQNTNSGTNSVISSGTSNNISAGASNTAIVSGLENQIISSGNNSFIGAGRSNTIGGVSGINTAAIIAGFANTNRSARAFIGSGWSNTISSNARSSVIVGGDSHLIQPANPVFNNVLSAVIVGGQTNLIGSNGLAATIGGGRFNDALAPGATVPGGFANEASGTNSFAAGSQAVASNTGTFVWGDMSTNTDFVSTAANQYLIRAGGGVGINTNNPGTNSLLVRGRAQVSGDLQVTGQIFGNLSVSNADLNSVSASNSFSIQTAGTTAWFASAQATNFSPNFLTNFNGRNIVAGFSSNSVAAGVIGATIAGGGGVEVGALATGYNQVTANFGTVGGGFGNQANGEFSLVAGGDQNKATALYTTVVGGFFNQSIGTHSFIGAGDRNTAIGNLSVIGGGRENTNSGNFSIVGSGLSNRATGIYATVPGGFANVATNNAFAAGTRAKATNNGAFVWADSQSVDFGSTTTNQFLVRAQNGVGINTNNTGSNALSVNGSVQIMTVQILTGAGAPTMSANNGSLYLRTGGGSSDSLYMRIGGSWVAFSPNVP